MNCELVDRCWSWFGNAMAFQSWVTDTLELEESVLRSQSADVEVACGQLLGRKSFQFECRSGATKIYKNSFNNLRISFWRTQTKRSVETVSAKTKFWKTWSRREIWKVVWKEGPLHPQMLRLLLMAKFDCCMRCSGRQTRRPLQLPTWIHILARQMSLANRRLGDDLSAFVPV